MSKKMFIGMVHLKALPTAPDNQLSVDEIVSLALQDLKSLEEGGATHVIVENFFDIPYSNSPNFETLISYTTIFTRIKEQANIPIGVNIHSCSNTEEITIATLCGADFIRAESFVEKRHSMGGILNPMAASTMRKRKELNSSVKIFADINVKETYPYSPQTIEEAINDVIKAKANALILTGLETGNAPSAEDAKKIKKLVTDIPLLIGSGVNENNISGLLEYSDGVIVGSSLKQDKKLDNPIDLAKVKLLASKI